MGWLELEFSTSLLSFVHRLSCICVWEGQGLLAAVLACRCRSGASDRDLGLERTS